MATKTTNYKLIKPAQSDYYDVDVFNNNADTIDGVLYGLFDDLTDNMNRLDDMENNFFPKSGGKVYGGVVIRDNLTIENGSINFSNTSITEKNENELDITAKLTVNGNATYDNSRIMMRVIGKDPIIIDKSSDLSQGNIVLYVEDEVAE